MKKDRASRWPIGISLSIVAIFFAAVATVVVAVNNPVQLTNEYMMDYHQGDANFNKLISEKIDFDKSYTIRLLTKDIKMDSTALAYMIEDKMGQRVEDAKIDLIWTRPDIRDFDIKQEKPTLVNNQYIFKSTVLPKEGRWNIIAHVSVGDKARYYSLKVDTRNDYMEEYGY